ncbi:hypothetical protein [Mannheimia sp. ZY171111]|nr:hypothetical protein [Mannheimia sp. ZY171111]QTM01048.1 hypothetical protein GM698_05285 [Mannheimia sp. ZY171111]
MFCKILQENDRLFFPTLESAKLAGNDFSRTKQSMTKELSAHTPDD